MTKTLEAGNVLAMVTLVTIALGAFHWLAKGDAKEVIKEEYSKLTDAITQLTQTVMKLDIRLDQSIKNQAEQKESIKRQDKRLDEHDIRLARLEEHEKGEN